MTMLRAKLTRIRGMIRYYQAAIVNTIFGISMYSLLVWLGMNLFVAQAISHVMGVAFNYFSYSRHVFTEASPAKLRFIASYAANYFVNLTILAALSHFISSPYIAGIIVVLIVSILNYFMLKHLVFRITAT